MERMWDREEIIWELKSRGKRITQQRKVLIDVILEKDWECCKEIYYEASKRDPSIGMATVYRMLGTLEEIGVMGRNGNYWMPVPEKENQCEKIQVSVTGRRESRKNCASAIGEKLRELLKENGYLDNEDYRITIIVDN